jgi:hypothetical protein
VNRTADGKVFVGFLALVLRSRLLDRIKGCKETGRLSLEKALIELRKIRVAACGGSCRLLAPITKLQRTILGAIGVSPEKLMESINNGIL